MRLAQWLEACREAVKRLIGRNEWRVGESPEHDEGSGVAGHGIPEVRLIGGSITRVHKVEGTR